MHGVSLDNSKWILSIVIEVCQFIPNSEYIKKYIPIFISNNIEVKTTTEMVSIFPLFLAWQITGNDMRVCD